MHITLSDINNMSQRYRATFINCLSGAKSANLVGTCHSSQQTNLSIVSSVFHIGAHPPLIGLIFRPNTVPRHTFENILNTGWFTLNHVTADIYEQAHQTSARYPQDTSEFAAVGLTEQWFDHIPVPFVEQSPVKMALKLIEHTTLTVNQTELVIAEIQHIVMPEEVIAEDGSVDLAQTQTVAVTGLDTYHQLKKLNRLSYAKPQHKPKII